MIPSIVLLVLGAISSTFFIISKVTKYTFKTIVLKTIASLFFIALAITCIAYNQKDIIFGIVIILGLFFGLLGDVFLGFKYVIEKKKKLFIMLGMFAFLFGHVSYVTALSIKYYIPGNILFVFLPFILATVLTTTYLLVAPKLGIQLKKFTPFGASYIFCLTSVFSTALFMNILNRFNYVTLIMILVGSVFFATSDFMLTGSYFKDGERSKAYRAIYSVAYYIAQFLIAFSLLFIL